MLMDARPIGVFDSGLGGLTNVRELRKLLPNEDIVYFGDTGRVPYGTRGRDIILQYARQDITFLLSQNVKYIIAACGTVSSTFSQEEASLLPVPYMGVVESSVESALSATKNGKIGVIGTSATIRSKSYETLLKAKMPSSTIITKACPMFVPLVENGYFKEGDPVAKLLIEEYLTPLKQAGVDTIILGCTHYPLLKKGIGDFVGDDVHLVDPGKVTAHYVRKALSEKNLLSDDKKGIAKYYVSDSPTQFATSADLFLRDYKGGEVEQISIDKY